MIRELCTLVGAFSLLVGASLLAFAIIAGTLEYVKQCRHRRETLDTTCGWLVWRCLKCGERRDLGYAFLSGSNRKARKGA